MPWSRNRSVRLALWSLLGTLFWPGVLPAGGGPENVLLLIDPTSPVSLQVGHYYRQARGIPARNVLYLEPRAGTYTQHREVQERALLGTLAQRGLASEIDYIVVPPGSSFHVAAPMLITDACSPVNRFSLTSPYTFAFIGDQVSSGLPATHRNEYFSGGNVPRAFDSETQWSLGNPVPGPGFPRYFIGALLGYDGERGNTVEEIIAMIDRSVGADGTHPSGTFYFIETTDPLRSPPRDPFFPAVVAAIEAAGGEAEHLLGVLPTGFHDCLGVLTGWANPDIDGGDFTLVPGAFADHLTSFSATFDTAAQTKLSEWIRRGASGSVGAVEEPCNYPGKFPHPRVHLYYHQGLSLGEAAFRSLEYLPFQVLLYGDPITRPFAHLPEVSVPGFPSGPVSGAVTLIPEVTTTHPTAGIAALTLWVDGAPVDTIEDPGPGSAFVLDTSSLADGAHEVRVVARDDSLVASVGHWVGTLETDHRGRSVTLSVTPPGGDLSTAFQIAVEANGGDVSELRFERHGSILATARDASTSWTLLGREVGPGPVEVQAVAVFDDGHEARSPFFTVDVTAENPPSGDPGIEAPIAYGYTRRLATADPTVLELPASDADGSMLTVEIVEAPVFGEITLVGPVVLLEPLDDPCGDDTLVFRVSDGFQDSGLATITVQYARRPFIRGDINGDGVLDLVDAIALLSYLFAAGDPPTPDVNAGDVNGDDVLTVADCVFLLVYLFASGDDPPAPFPEPGCED